MIQFFGSNIECFEHVRYVHQIFEGARYVWGNYSIINGLVYIKSFEKDYKYFFINFSGLQPEFFTIIIHLIQQSSTHLKESKGFWCHSFILDKETEAAYDNYKSYDWKLSILWFPGITTNRKSSDSQEQSIHIIIAHIMW